MSVRRWRSLALFLAGLTVLFCLPFLFSSDILKNSGDVFDYAGPFRYFAARSLQAGTWPLWNPYIFAGTPFLASPQSALFYPLNQMFWFFPLAQAVDVFTAVHLFLNAFGMSLFLMGTGRRGAAPWLGGVAWGFGLFFLGKVGAGHIIHLSGYAWMGVVLLAGLRGRAGLLAAAGALQFFTGHLQVAEHAAFYTAVLALAVSGRKGPRLLRGLAGAVAAAVLVAVQLFPTLGFLGRTTRAAGIFDVGSRVKMAVSYSLEPSAWKALLFPVIVGHPFNGTFTGGPPSVFFESFTLFIGWIPLILALGTLAVFLRRGRWGIPLALAGFLALALGGNGPLEFLFHGCLINQRAPARFIAGVLFVLVWMGAAFLSGRRWRGVAVALVLLTTVDLYVHGRGFLRSEDASVHWVPGPGSKAMEGTGPFMPRVALSQGVPMQNKGMMTGYSNVNGYEALVPGNIVRMAVRTQPGLFLNTTGIDVTDPHRPGFRELASRYALLPAEVPGWRIAARLGPGYLNEDPAPLPPLRIVSGKAELRAVRHPRPERLDALLSASGPFVLRWSERYDPGWASWVNDRVVPSREAAGVVQEVQGDHVGATWVRWRYRPEEVRAGGRVSGLAWILFAGGAFLFFKKLI